MKLIDTDGKTEETVGVNKIKPIKVKKGTKRVVVKFPFNKNIKIETGNVKKTSKNIKRYRIAIMKEGENTWTDLTVSTYCYFIIIFDL